MGRDFSQRPSQLLKIEDELLAFDFDATCTARLKVDDDAREQRLLEAASGGLLSQALGNGHKSSGPIEREVIGEVTQANFRDQGF
jgi:hypothetical protein